jgi:uncharacterized membrane protein
MHAVGVNDRGDIVGRSFGAGPGHGFVLHQGTFTTIDVPGAIFTEALGINNRGDIVGDYGNASGEHAFILEQGIFTTIGADVIIASGINERADIVGLYVGAGGWTTASS